VERGKEVGGGSVSRWGGDERGGGEGELTEAQLKEKSSGVEEPADVWGQGGVRG